MAEELEVKEITELNDVSFSDESLVLAYTEDEGVGKATFAKAKEAIGCDVSLEQTETGTTPSAENRITATFRNGLETKKKEFVIRNGTGISRAAQEENTDENGLRSNTVSLESSDKTLVQDLNFTVKDGVGIKAHSQEESTDANGLRKNTLGVSYTNGESDSVEIKDGVGIKTHSQEESADENGLRSSKLSLAYTDGGENTVVVKDGVGIKAHSVEKKTDENGLSKSTLSVSCTDGKTDTVEISDGIGIKSAAQTKASTLSGELNEYTVKLTDGTESKIKVYNGRAGKDFRIKKTYASIAEMKADFSGDEVETYEFAMIDTGSVEDTDTGKLYCKGETEWKYIGDLSGAQGIKGDTGNGIASVENTLTEEGKIKVIIKMTDGTSNEFLINNGLQYTAGKNVSISDSNEISVDLSGKNDKITVIEDTSSDLTDSATFSTTSNGAGSNPTNITKRPLSLLWNYIKEKIASALGLTSTSYSGNASKASQLQAFTGDDFTGGNHFIKAIRNSNGWGMRLKACYDGGEAQSNDISVGYADNAGSAGTATTANRIRTSQPSSFTNGDIWIG